MNNSLKLTSGKEYIVIKSFVDYDGIIHNKGETWTFLETNFLPYENGLTLHVIQNNQKVVYRLQWRKEAQAEVIENFKEYVKPIDI